MKEYILKLVAIFQAHPYSLTFFGLLSCGLGVPLPEEFFLVMSGFVCHKNGIPDVAGLIPMFICTWVAIGGGDLIAFTVGRRWGGKVFEFRLVKKLVSEKGRMKAEEFLMRYGSRTIFAARFLPGIRMPTYLLCGTLKVPYATFMLWDGLAMLISVPIQVYLAWRFGDVLDVALQKVAKLNQGFLAMAIVIVLFIYFRLHSGAGVPGPSTVKDAHPGDGETKKEP
jgi:membrane protein DedA with SNARE-associated domain